LAGPELRTWCDRVSSWWYRRGRASRLVAGIVLAATIVALAISVLGTLSRCDPDL
jgi:hypothetical protein